ncbi:hypothetical protein KB553_09540 [Chryseobacterium rhizoplanae]|uniref:hypothetical protein n=1 Tax=Chryseobacterium rhizoplanae TaxID=1609531 RepID=UPI001CE324BC|nr:hypothetical protein [Chryseobacterium rhizoplanae]UCA61756.1 hypothetical protein KB553_09540 [Chryseobacterium rhizoplanae]
MEYTQALEHKKDILKCLGELRSFNYTEIMIMPAKAEDFERYMEEYRKDPGRFDDQSCIQFSTDNNFMVYRIGEDKFLNCRQGKI